MEEFGVLAAAALALRTLQAAPAFGREVLAFLRDLDDYRYRDHAPRRKR